MPAGVVANQGPNGGARSGAKGTKKKGATARPSSPGGAPGEGDMDVEPMSLSNAEANDDAPAPAAARGKASKSKGKAAPKKGKSAPPPALRATTTRRPATRRPRRTCRRRPGPAGKKRAKKTTAVSGGAVANTEATDEQNDGETPPNDDALRDMRVRARTERAAPRLAQGGLRLQVRARPAEGGGRARVRRRGQLPVQGGRGAPDALHAGGPLGAVLRRRGGAAAHRGVGQQAAAERRARGAGAARVGLPPRRRPGRDQHHLQGDQLGVADGHVPGAAPVRRGDRALRTRCCRPASSASSARGRS